jgi:two-component system alkaline phosphatase synthesis response regulator PhoP
MSTAGKHILVVEDDVGIATGLSLNLRLAGHTPSVAPDGEAALRRTAETDYDLILLDLNLPKINGLEVLTGLRATDNVVPVIVISARDGEVDKVAALRLGADDYVTKPFALAELLARIDAVLRRTARPAPAPSAAVPAASTLQFGDVTLDLGQRTVQRAGELVKLTHMEFELLAFLVRHPLRVFSRDELFSEVWGHSAGTARTVDNFVGQLRKRLEVDPEQPRHLVTVRGSGYRFDP